MATAKKVFKRSGAKSYTFVDFEVAYCGEVISLPKLQQVPTKVHWALRTDDMGPVIDFVAKHGGVDLAEFLFESDLDSQELGEFFEAWAKASGAEQGK